MKQHRAFISRSNLKVLKNGKKYLFLYHKKNNAFAVLVKRKNIFYLYTLSDPKQEIYFLHTRQKKNHVYALNHFKSIGYKRLISPYKKGYVISVSHKRYKGVKTLLFDLKDYSRLLKLYKKSIREYNANPIKSIKMPLPKSLILDYFNHYKKRAKNKNQFEQLQIIANKLKIRYTIPAKVSTQNSSGETKIDKKIVKEKQSTKESSNTQESSVWYDFSREKSKVEKIKKRESIQKQITTKEPAPLPYTYYKNASSLNELNTYLSKKTTIKSLSPSEYLALEQRKKRLEEKKLLKDGSIEELIAAYKHNKKPEFKQRILSLMKEKHKK
jgi:hypothetical protein